MAEPTRASNLGDDAAAGEHQTVASQVSNFVVQVTHEYTGRGPTGARTYITDDLVTTVLRGVLTKGENVLAEGDDETAVHAMRVAYQKAMRTDLIAGIEKIMGREVVALMSANHIDPDIAVELFVLKSS